jgi:hypothetical protein
MITREWTSPLGGDHTMYATESDARDEEGNELLSAYVVRRPDGTWATLLVNKSPSRAYRVTLDFGGGHGGRASGRRTVVSYSGAQYAWMADGPRGRPLRSEAPGTRTLRAGERPEVPPYSLTVIREARPGARQ